MRALILSANTGGGHNSCAKAIKEVFIAHGDTCDIEDCLEFISKGVSKSISDGHIFLYRHAPALFQAGYRAIENNKTTMFQENSLIFKFFALGAENLYELISTMDYDTVICTHLIGAMMLTAMLKKHPLPIVTCHISTDYDCSPSTADSDLDFYFIPDKRLMDEFVKAGIPKEKVFPSGLPVRKEFYEHRDKALAKEEIGLPKDHAHLLVMCGSMGGGPIPKVVNMFSEKLKEDQEMTIVCGSNKALYDKITEKHSGVRNIHIIGNTNEVPKLMQAADLLFTKPGGLSTSEAYAAKLPMAFFNFIGCYETDNLNFFVKLGGAMSKEDPQELVDATLELLADPERLKAMSNALADASKDKPIPEDYIYEVLRKAHENLK